MFDAIFYKTFLGLFANMVLGNVFFICKMLIFLNFVNSLYLVGAVSCIQVITP